MALSRAKAFKELEEKKSLQNQVNLVIIKPGDALNFPGNGDSIAIHYVGFLADGTMFDNSYNRGQPVYFVLGAGHVIKGWEIILPLLSKGEKARITVPQELAYGDKGYPPIIPPLSTLVFEIELLSFSSVGQVERIHRAMKQKQELSLL